MPKTISQLSSAITPNINYVIPSDNSNGTLTEKLTIQQINDLSRTYSVLNLGTVSGNTSINFAADRLIQILTLNGTSTTLLKGTGWPSSVDFSADVILKITVSSATTVTWTIVTQWYNQPPAGALSVDTHLVLLRAVGNSIIEGHYIGRRTL